MSNMEIEVVRDIFRVHCTMGKMAVNGAFFGYTLEDTVRAVKIQNETAIPCGRFKLVPHFSPHLKTIVPMLVNVPNYTLVYIHWGNKPEDTDGCILVGESRSLTQDYVANSKVTFGKLMIKLANEWNVDREVWLTVSSAGERGVASVKA